MLDELRYGRFKYFIFLVLDVILLIAANLIAAWVYLERTLSGHYGYEDYRSVLLIMVAIDLLVTVFFNTLCRVLRRKKRKEIIEGLKHVGISFVALAVVLYSLRLGADYSRVTVFLAYGIYFLFFVGSHIVISELFRRVHKYRASRNKKARSTAILMTTDRFADEGLEELKKLNVEVKTIWLLKNINKNSYKGIPIVKTWEEVAAVTCWHELDKVYIYGLDHQMVPAYLISAFKDMKLKLNLVDFNYRVIDVTTVKNADPKYGALSFLEGKRDIPFPIRRVYWITETEAELHRGFHAHKLNCQLLYCPYGVIDIILDDGQKKTTVTLDQPGKGLLLMPGLWREMVWKKSGSVLCVLASEYYDADEYIRNYDEFIEYNKNYRDSADPLKQNAVIE